MHENAGNGTAYRPGIIIERGGVTALVEQVQRQGPLKVFVLDARDPRDRNRIGQMDTWRPAECRVVGHMDSWMGLRMNPEVVAAFRRKKKALEQQFRRADIIRSDRERRAAATIA
ncbi:hypothetical protein C4552_03620 [Candidatus Parcubacteria bacterium]|nr:MAG: hypothetical protein C4552_03620 [Candidatus Parcubacteria bacterium]